MVIGARAGTRQKSYEVRTEKEAVNKALEMAVIDDDIIKAHEVVGSKGDEVAEVGISQGRTELIGGLCLPYVPRMC